MVDKHGVFLGAVPSRELLKIMYEEANQDFFYMAGSSKAVVKDPILLPSENTFAVDFNRTYWRNNIKHYYL